MFSRLLSDFHTFTADEFEEFAHARTICIAGSPNLIFSAAFFATFAVKIFLLCVEKSRKP